MRIEVVYRGVVIGSIHDARARHTITTPCVIERNDYLNINVYDAPGSGAFNYNVLTQIAAATERQANASERTATFQGNIETAINEEFAFLHALCNEQRLHIDKLNAELAESREEGASESSS